MSTSKSANARRVVAITLASLITSALATEPDATPAAATAAPDIPGWDAFADELRQLDNAIMAKFPEHQRNDPQIQQEAGRLLLESLVPRVLDAIAADGDHPVFLPWINVTLNTLQPNADTVYKKALITPGGTYRIRGDRGSLRILKMAQVWVFPEETGKTNPGIGIVTYNDFNALNADANGHIDVILSATRPAGYTGDWWELNARTKGLLIRQVAYDWSRERDPRFSIERLDAPITRPRPPAADLERRLREIAALTGNTAIVLADHVDEVRKQGAINRLQEWNAGGTKLTQTGGLIGQFYYEGAYELKDDEALIFEAKVPSTCGYWSMILTNDVYETTDWYNNHSSLNGAQARVDSDGKVRAVISAKDPGVPNWLDTAGYASGVIQGRWTDCNEQPIPTLRKVAFSRLRRELPKGTPAITADEREKIVRERRAQLQWRPLW
jgi:Protein of unknown function (DUF1214)